jgi:ABC-type dipeptide/oligopeptide/nickel transport system permease subunit
MTKRESRIAFNIKRIKGFLNALRRSKRGLVGIAILIAAIVVAIAAPLFTPYNPVSSFNLAADWAEPSWARYLGVPALWGGGLSGNLIPVDQNLQMQMPDALKEYNITVLGSTSARSNAAVVTVSGTPLVSISPTSAILSYAKGQSRQFTSNVSTSIVPYSYRWYLNGSAVAQANKSTWKFMPTFPGTYTIYVVVTTKLGVQVSSNIATVTSNDSPSASISPTLTSLSYSQSQTFTAHISGGTGTYTYQWYANGVAIQGATNSTWTFTPSSEGSYGVYVIATENDNIQAQNSVAVQHSTFGIIQGGPGSIEISTNQINELPLNSSITIRITKDFYYPYSGIPGSMNATAAILASELDGVAVRPCLILGHNWLTYTSLGVATYNITRFEFGNSPKVPITLAADNFTFTKRFWCLGWVEPLTSIIYQASGLGIDVLQQCFPQPGSYSYGVDVTVTKLSENATSTVYVDNMDLQLLGSSFGWLGTDGSGRDVFTQLVYGTRISLYVGLVASIIGVVIGLIVGLVSAYVGGVVDEVLMRFTDALLVLPGLPLMIVLITIVANGQYNLNIFIMVIGLLGWMGFARVVRSQVLSLKERPYVEAAKAVGAGTPYILFRHILPNVVVLIYVTLALSVPGAIVAEAAFSFLGFIDPSQMSWGRMLNSIINKPEIWWVIIPPGLAIAILSMSFILIGYAMDDILNPKLRARR